MANSHFENQAVFTLLSLFFTSVFPFFSLATSIISPDQPLRDGQTLTSTGNVFALGFFSPNGSNLRYVGLWFQQFPERVVWVANRDNPLMDSSGIMMIAGLSEKSNLFIVDGRNKTVWKALNETNDGNHRSVQNAELNSLGKLILFDRNGSELWQGFDHPTDTILPGMKIGVDRRTGDELFMSSWKRDNDPSTGSFRVLVNAQRPPQIYIWNGSTKHYRTGQWNGKDFIGTRFLDNVWPIGYTMDYVPENGTLYFGIAPLNYLNPLFLNLDPLGYTVISSWNESGKFEEFLLPDTPCAFYGTCGSSALCDDGDKKSFQSCTCFKGFIPKNESEWNKGNWKEGCERKEMLRCERNSTASQDVGEDGFFEYQRTKLADHGVVVLSSGDKDSCEAACLRNCSCAGYAFVDTMGCMVWDDFVDVQRYAGGGENFYLKLPQSELGTKKRSKDFVIELVVPLATLGLCLLAYIVYRWRAKRRRSLAGDSHIYDIRREGNSEVRVFSYKDIEAATDKFSSGNKLGEGGFGPVFKGKLVDGQVVAVKRLSRGSGQGLEEFKNEVILISKLQHKNLVNLIGFCIQEEEKLLVYEYMPNKSLDKFILGCESDGEATLLDWNMRYHIIEGNARGILYLHRDSRLRIIHRDLKTSNILLDEGMRPKISDFGMARIFGGDQSAANTNRLVGTYGYMSPEYGLQGIFSEKSDIFSFGVIVLEIVAGRKSIGFHYNQNPITLQGHVWKQWKEGKALEVLDSKLVDYNPSQVIRCIHVGLLCVQDDANDRPTMATILSMLTNDMPLQLRNNRCSAQNETSRIQAHHLRLPRPITIILYPLWKDGNLHLHVCVVDSGQVKRITTTIV